MCLEGLQQVDERLHARQVLAGPRNLLERRVRLELEQLHQRVRHVRLERRVESLRHDVAALVHLLDDRSPIVSMCVYLTLAPSIHTRMHSYVQKLVFVQV